MLLPYFDLSAIKFFNFFPNNHRLLCFKAYILYNKGVLSHDFQIKGGGWGAGARLNFGDCICLLNGIFQVDQLWENEIMAPRDPSQHMHRQRYCGEEDSHLIFDKISSTLISSGLLYMLWASHLATLISC